MEFLVTVSTLEATIAAKCCASRELVILSRLQMGLEDAYALYNNCARDMVFFNVALSGRGGSTSSSSGSGKKQEIKKKKKTNKKGKNRRRRYGRKRGIGRGGQPIRRRSGIKHVRD